MYLCIDMKCFFASVECVERGLNPLTTPLVVADKDRGKGALCLAVSPYLKEKGVKNRGRLYDIKKDISYIIAKPRMKLYIDYAVRIHRIFLKYVDGRDIHTYSIDEAFLSVKEYINLYGSISILAYRILEDIKKELGLIATCGAGDNLYLAKLSLDLLAKKKPSYYHFLTLEEFYQTIWHHKNLKDIWQIGSGITRRLHQMGLYSLYDVAMTRVQNLEKEFGVVGRDLYEHAWGKDETTINDIKSYEPLSKSMSRHQILFKDYTKSEAWIPLVEMLFLICMDLVGKDLLMRNISFYVGYSRGRKSFHKEFTLDYYSSDFYYIKEVLKKYYISSVEDEMIRRIGITFSDFIDKETGLNTLFYKTYPKREQLSKTIEFIWQRYGKNSLVIGTALEKESTLYQRNLQIGGHNSE